MERIFTKDVGRNFKQGEIRDYALATWREIARSAKQDLDDFTTPVIEAAKAAAMARQGKRPTPGT
jgi:hypothetical protein